MTKAAPVSRPFPRQQVCLFFPFVKKIAKISPFIGERRQKKKERKKKEGYWNVRGVRNEVYSFRSVPAALDTGVPTTEWIQPLPLPLPSLQFHGCNCDLLFREPAFKLSTLKVFHASYHPLIEFKTDACTRSGDIALTSGCTDFTSRHAAETDSGN